MELGERKEALFGTNFQVWDVHIDNWCAPDHLLRNQNQNQHRSELSNFSARKGYLLLVGQRRRRVLLRLVGCGVTLEVWRWVQQIPHQLAVRCVSQTARGSDCIHNPSVIASLHSHLESTVHRTENTNFRQRPLVLGSFSVLGFGTSGTVLGS